MFGGVIFVRVPITNGLADPSGILFYIASLVLLGPSSILQAVGSLDGPDAVLAASVIGVILGETKGS